MGQLLEDLYLWSSVTKPQFYALDNPCLEKFRLCSTSCSVSYMTGSLNCQFCVCDDPRFSIAWPESTTALPATTTTPRPTLPEGQWMANNIIYTRLKHPCSEFYAACPLLCKRENITFTNGTTCETCTCDRDFFNILGRREYPEKFSLHKRHASKHKDYNKMGHVPRPCFHFGCPIFRCPEGLRFAISPSGCEECRCISIDPLTTTPAQISTTAAGNENFIQMYCRKEPSDCPPGCSVVDFRVTDWHCYHCHCPENSYVALQKPCDQQNFLCSTQCTVRHLVNSRNQTDSCEFCDCTASARFGRKHKISRRDTTCPYHCPHYCHYSRQKSSGTFGQPFGRRKRQSLGCYGDCSQCPYIIILPRFKLQTVLQQNHISIQQTGTLNTHKATTSKPYMETSTRSIPDMTTKSLTTNERTTHKTTTGSIIQKPTTVVTTRSNTPGTTATTTSSSTITTSTTSTPSTTTTVRSTTVAPPMCHTCSNVTCSSADLQECNTGSEYCMNTLKQHSDGSRTITRGCVSENECYNKWWIVSADNPSCLSKVNTPTGRPGAPIECNFCCKGAGCNQLMRIPDSLLYTGEDHPSNAMGGIIQIG
ncbi:uncharacterized protein LOC133198097 [Saccostrea echinata]|uniref:uncharacterized protein LOC133198097 n=1 Tax=Saccostrea echinata TaxID=191078 RepID=UPI002A7FB6B2|nr:uncharacterized protein LOC133198097 [Saccostrea echinata]